MTITKQTFLRNFLELEIPIQYPVELVEMENIQGMKIVIGSLQSVRTVFLNSIVLKWTLEETGEEGGLKVVTISNYFLRVHLS